MWAPFAWTAPPALLREAVSSPLSPKSVDRVLRRLHIFSPTAVWPALLCLLAILAVHAAFVLAFVPAAPPEAPYSLRMTPEIAESVRRLLSEDWVAFLLPHEYESGRHYWATTVIPLTYLAERYLGGLGSYLLFSSLFAGVSFVLGLAVSRSILFAATLAYMFAFGTQLNYVYTYGNTTALYLVLTYAAVNFTIAALILQERIGGPLASAGFVASLVVLAVSNEMWLNYATAMIAVTAFGLAWAARHREGETLARSGFLFAATVLVLIAYLLVRLRLVHQYLAPGAEEELLVTYEHKILFVEDAVANLFTLLYLTLSNYLPAFVTSSSALTYLDKAAILAEQHGYDQKQQHLIILNHLFLWRFYAGVLATLFLGSAGWAVVAAWRSPSVRPAVIAGLCLMVLAGFSTHLSIKMRPYNIVPALPYKALMSISAFTVLVTYMTTLAWRGFRSPLSRGAVVGGVWASVLLAALTRPAMQARLLSEVGLVGLGDPLGQLLQWLR
jgi:hypothetical protein